MFKPDFSEAVQHYDVVWFELDKTLILDLFYLSFRFCFDLLYSIGQCTSYKQIRRWPDSFQNSTWNAAQSCNSSGEASHYLCMQMSQEMVYFTNS